MVAGTIGGANGAAGYLATTRDPNLLDGSIATGVGATQGLASVLLPGAGTFVQGAAIGGFGDTLQQIIIDTNQSINLWEVGTATVSNSLHLKLFGAANLGSSWAEQVGANTIAWPFTTGATAIGQALGTPSTTTPVMQSPNSFFGTGAASFNGGLGPQSSIDSGAAGGFLIYPNMVNTNQMQSVYAKP